MSRERERNLLLMGCPALWACWPMLPLVRRCRGKEELGLLFDALRANGTTLVRIGRVARPCCSDGRGGPAARLFMG
jgi:hypothetical protein